MRSFLAKRKHSFSSDYVRINDRSSSSIHSSRSRARRLALLGSQLLFSPTNEIYDLPKANLCDNRLRSDFAISRMMKSVFPLCRRVFVFICAQKQREQSSVKEMKTTQSSHGTNRCVLCIYHRRWRAVIVPIYLLSSDTRRKCASAWCAVCRSRITSSRDFRPSRLLGLLCSSSVDCFLDNVIDNKIGHKEYQNVTLEIHLDIFILLHVLYLGSPLSLCVIRCLTLYPIQIETSAKHIWRFRD